MSTNLIASIAPGLAEVLAVIGSTLGVYKVIAAGIPATAEDPAQRGRIMILAFLPATQTMLYGFLYMFVMYSSILPLLFRAHSELPPHIAGAVLGISMFVGLAQLLSAWMQGRVCADGVAQLVKTRGAIYTPTLILATYEELFGILGMVFGYLMANMVAGWA
jgi:V/A-type H+-transporting ATPase subunit K